MLHGFIGEKITKEGAKKMVRKIAETFSLPYFTLTPTFSICPIHGYLAGEHEYCPKCDEENPTQIETNVIKMEAKNETNQM